MPVPIIIRGSVPLVPGFSALRAAATVLKKIKSGRFDHDQSKAERTSDGTWVLSLDVECVCSSMRASETIDGLDNLSPFVADAVEIVASMGDDPTHTTWLGSDAAVEAAKRRDRIREARDALSVLTYEDRITALVNATPPS